MNIEKSTTIVFTGHRNITTDIDVLKSILLQTIENQTKLLKRILDIGWQKIDDYWASIKICIRNGYKIKDATLWCDYIDFLRFFGKDLHNAKYVCPTNLKAEHDRYVTKKAKADDFWKWKSNFKRKPSTDKPKRNSSDLRFLMALSAFVCWRA